MLMFLLVISITSCANKSNKNTDNDNNATQEDSVFMLDGPGSVYEPSAEEVGLNALETVEEVYKAVSKAYRSKDWQRKSADLDEQFCSKDWLTTVAAVIEKDNKSSDEMGFFDADYWVMGQDFDEKNLHASDFSLEKILLDDTPWEAAVTLKLHNFSDIPVRVNLVYEDGAWKVDDLTDLSSDLDWKASMKEYLAE